MTQSRVYIITNNSEKLNFRASKLNELSNQFEITLICQKVKGRKSRFGNTLLIKSRLNFVSFFKKINLRALSEYLNSKIYFPSPVILYVQNVIRYLEKIISTDISQKFILITICPPHDIALVGYKLKRKFPQIVWYNDLQDLWTIDEYYFNRLSFNYRKKALDLENRLFKTADKTILTNEYAKDYCIEKFSLDQGKVTHIYHPFDESSLIKEDFTTEDLVARIGNKRILNFAFVGNLFKEPKVPGSLLLDELARFCKTFDWPLNLNIIGTGIPQKFRKNLVANFTIKQYPGLSHADAYKQAACSDFLILLLGNVPNSKMIMHGKFPHYLATGRPILAFVPEGSFIQKSIFTTNSGFFIDLNSDIVKSLYNVFMSIPDKGFPIRNEPEVEKFGSSNFLKEWSCLIGEDTYK